MGFSSACKNFSTPTKSSQKDTQKEPNQNCSDEPAVSEREDLRCRSTSPNRPISHLGVSRDEILQQLGFSSACKNFSTPARESSQIESQIEANQHLPNQTATSNKGNLCYKPTSPNKTVPPLRVSRDEIMHQLGTSSACKNYSTPARESSQIESQIEANRHLPNQTAISNKGNLCYKPTSPNKTVPPLRVSSDEIMYQLGTSSACKNYFAAEFPQNEAQKRPHENLPDSASTFNKGESCKEKGHQNLPGKTITSNKVKFWCRCRPLVDAVPPGCDRDNEILQQQQSAAPCKNLLASAIESLQDGQLGNERESSNIATQPCTTVQPVGNASSPNSAESPSAGCGSEWSPREAHHSLPGKTVPSRAGEPWYRPTTPTYQTRESNEILQQLQFLLPYKENLASATESCQNGAQLDRFSNTVGSTQNKLRYKSTSPDRAEQSCAALQHDQCISSSEFLQPANSPALQLQMKPENQPPKYLPMECLPNSFALANSKSPYQSHKNDALSTRYNNATSLTGIRPETHVKKMVENGCSSPPSYQKEWSLPQGLAYDNGDRVLNNEQNESCVNENISIHQNQLRQRVDTNDSCSNKSPFAAATSEDLELEYMPASQRCICQMPSAKLQSPNKSTSPQRSQLRCKRIPWQTEKTASSIKSVCSTPDSLRSTHPRTRSHIHGASGGQETVNTHADREPRSQLYENITPQISYPPTDYFSPSGTIEASAMAQSIRHTSKQSPASSYNTSFAEPTRARTPAQPFKPLFPHRAASPCSPPHGVIPEPSRPSFPCRAASPCNTRSTIETLPSFETGEHRNNKQPIDNQLESFRSKGMQCNDLASILSCAKGTDRSQTEPKNIPGSARTFFDSPPLPICLPQPPSHWNQNYYNKAPECTVVQKEENYDNDDPFNLNFRPNQRNIQPQENSPVTPWFTSAEYHSLHHSDEPGSLDESLSSQYQIVGERAQTLPTSADPCSLSSMSQSLMRNTESEFTEADDDIPPVYFNRARPKNKRRKIPDSPTPCFPTSLGANHQPAVPELLVRSGCSSYNQRL